MPQTDRYTDTHIKLNFPLFASVVKNSNNVNLLASTFSVAAACLAAVVETSCSTKYSSYCTSTSCSVHRSESFPRLLLLGPMPTDFAPEIGRTYEIMVFGENIVTILSRFYPLNFHLALKHNIFC